MHLLFGLVTCVLCFKIVDTFLQCTASTQSVKNVLHCPKNETEWTTAKTLKGCGTIQQNCSEFESLEYHCVPTEDEDVYVDLCAFPIMSHGGFCTEWNTGGETLQPSGNRSCTASSNPCPNSYLSNETYNYHICYKTNITEHSQMHGSNSTIRLQTRAILPMVLGVTISFLRFRYRR
ncbi:uncharacterized protein LOC133178737 isoform X2 [Saccostrea echinata]|uniref:uncharacterized protein LOC133178737 isoform X2 n=1 Tax=Saccostrea echinata TaxID=191078 RepID=UPI002A8270B8|nr:uncharacterized protein LOC133178737 isoform X2 [Saccostrea echinata]